MPNFTLLAAAASLLSAQTSVQAPPALPGGVTWSNPPTPQEREKTPSEKFVVFAREPTGQGQWDFVPSIWEILPGTQEQMVPRVRFEKSMWSPSRLSIDPEFPFRDLVESRVGDMGRVNLFRVDYQSWEVRAICEGPNANELFWNGQDVYLDVAGGAPSIEGLRVLRHNTCAIERPRESFRYIRSLTHGSARQLVQRKGSAPGEYAVFDASTESIVASCQLPTDVESHYTDVAFSDDLSMCAMLLDQDISHGVDFMKLHQGQYVDCRIRLLALKPIGAAQEKQIPVCVVASPGSGLKFTCFGPQLRFAKNGRLQYLSSAKPPAAQSGEPSIKLTAYEYDPGTGISTKLAGDAAPSIATLMRMPPELHIPEELRPFMTEAYPDEHALAFAFLKSKGIRFDPPTAWSDAATGFSTDGKRFLLKMVRGGREDTFFLGDIEMKTLAEIPSPKSLQQANDMSIFCVPGP